MHEGLVTCAPATPLGEVARQLVAHRVHALVVAGADGIPLGVISDTDLLAGEWLGGDEEGLRVMASLTASDLMTTPPLTIRADADVTDAVGRMLAEGISRLLVESDGVAAGVLSVSDVVRKLGRPRGARGRVEDVMDHGFVACRAATAAVDAARLLSERRTRSLVVLGDRSDVRGVLTGRDLLAVVTGKVRPETPAGELASAPVTIERSAGLAEAAALMVDRETNRLLVVADGDPLPLGLVSSWDLVSEMAASDAWRAGGRE
jgi:CBS domain-containing protein